MRKKKEKLTQPEAENEDVLNAEEETQEAAQTQTESEEVSPPETQDEEVLQTEPEEDEGKPATEDDKKSGSFFSRLFKTITSPLTDTLNGIEADFPDRSRIRKTLISMFKLRVPICIILVLLNIFSAVCFLVKNDNTAKTEMSLNYEESAAGLNPNSTRFNAYDITSQEVVEKMLTYCGIDPESVDVNAVSNGISIRSTNAKAFSEENYYISTSYRITLTKPSFIKGVSAHEMLTFLCKAYKDNLYSKYTENRSIFDFDIERLNDKEYMEIADLLDLKAQQIEKYLNTRVKQSKTFTEQDSDETFKSLSQKVEDLRSYDIAKYRAFIVQSGTSYDKTRYTRSLSYVNLIKGLSYSKDMAAYNVRNDGIKMYNEAMISVVMIPSVDESKNTYYMSKTKTGMDYMASQADNYLLTAQETAKEIATNKDIISKMKAGTNEKSDIKKADKMIEEINQKFSDLSKQIETVDKAYIKYKTKDYLTFKTSNPSFMQKLKLSTLVVISAALLGCIYAAIWFRFRFFGGGKKSEGISITTLPFKG